MDLSSFDFLEKQNNNMHFESVYDRSCFNCLYRLNGSPTVAVYLRYVQEVGVPVGSNLCDAVLLGTIDVKLLQGSDEP